MSFKDEISELEQLEFNDDYIVLKGDKPILISAPHTMNQTREDGSIKPNEVFTKAIALYLNKYVNVNCFIKIKDTGLDSNRDNRDEYKTELIRYIKKNNIKLVLDIHGAADSRPFDVEFGTMNNLSADYSTIKELEEAFTENGIPNIYHNDPFKGGAITQYLYGIDDIDVIQVEINSKYRYYDNIELLEKLINSLINFINQYNDIIKNNN